MHQATPYPIGNPGQPWRESEKAQWLAIQRIKRSYHQWVLTRIDALRGTFDVQQYGALPYDETRYPLFIVRSHNWSAHNPVVLVTGGVHGYETSGVLGALRWLEASASSYWDDFNILVAPCVSPWGFETINRWNPNAVDPNRSFVDAGPSPEANLLMAYVSSLSVEVHAHFDLHETTDTDNSEFRPALAARDGSVHDNWNIPDGFYLVGDTLNPQAEFQRAVIQGVEQVTHIAPPDEAGKIIGAPLEQHGVINYSKKALGLCGGFCEANYVTTTEVYPDSDQVDEENCILAQVAAINAGLDHLLSK